MENNFIIIIQERIKVSRNIYDLYTFNYVFEYYIKYETEYKYHLTIYHLSINESSWSTQIITGLTSSDIHIFLNFYENSTIPIFC